MTSHSKITLIFGRATFGDDEPIFPVPCNVRHAKFSLGDISRATSIDSEFLPTEGKIMAITLDGETHEWDMPSAYPNGRCHFYMSRQSLVPVSLQAKP